LTTNKDLDLNITGDVNLVAQGDLNATVSGDCNATVTGKLIAKAQEIDLNGNAGSVLTTVTDPVVDTIFGEPTMGVDSVKAG